MDERGNISLPSDIGATAMTEREICELFGVIAPTVRAGIKALCKNEVLKEYGIKRLIRLPERSGKSSVSCPLKPKRFSPP